MPPSPSAAKYRTALTLAAGAAAAVTAQQQAGASVIYTPLDVQVNAASPTFEIDYDHDGLAEVGIKYDATAGLALTSPTQSKTAAYVGTGAPSIVKAMAAGDTIDGTLTLNGLVNIIPTSFPPITIPLDGTINNGAGAGDFTAAAGQRYIGINLAPMTPLGPTGPSLYGWLGFRVDDDSSVGAMSGTVTGFAYEDSGQPITAGAIPEPSSLGLLAMGATALAAYRRRAGGR